MDIINISKSLPHDTYVRVASLSPEIRVGDVVFNTQKIIESIHSLESEHVDVAVFPELCLTGYTCGDLFHQTALLGAVERAVEALEHESALYSSLCFAVGAPIKFGSSLYNCALIFANGLKGIVPKSFLPNYNEFYEQRWFKSGRTIRAGEVQLYSHTFATSHGVAFGTDLIFDRGDLKIGVEICEDLWVPEPPSGALAMAGAQLILNLSASDDAIGKKQYLRNLVAMQSARCRCAYAYASSGKGESSTDLVFSGLRFIAEDGSILSSREADNLEPAIADVDIDKLESDRRRFATFVEGAHDHAFRLIDISHSSPTNMGGDADHLPDLRREVKKHPFVDENPARLQQNCEEILQIQARGLAQRLRAIGDAKAVVGISGGLDSTLALLVCVKAFRMMGRSVADIVGVTMPGFGTTDRTHDNAVALMEELGVTRREIGIAPAVCGHFSDIGHDPSAHDATYENAQARERTQILMDIANQVGGIVIGTGDLSELALGWCTYNADQMSMYGVNASVPKTLVKYLVKAYAESAPEKVRLTLLDIIDTPISPELLPADKDGHIKQKTEDLVGPYELHDFFLYNMMRNSFGPAKIYHLARRAFEGQYSDAEIKKWLRTFYRRFFSQQFKRSCMPDGPKVGSICLSPRGDWRMPSDASAALWLEQVENL